MANTPNRSLDPDDFVSASSSGKLPAHLCKPLPPEAVLPSSDLDQQIMQMFALHPEIALEFRGQGDLADMDDATKKLLLTDIYTVLEIDPALGTF